MNPSAAAFSFGGNNPAPAPAPTNRDGSLKVSASAAEFRPSAGAPSFTPTTNAAALRQFTPSASEFVPTVAPAQSAQPAAAAHVHHGHSARHAAMYVPEQPTQDGHGMAASLAASQITEQSTGATNPYSRRHATQFVPAGAVEGASPAANPYAAHAVSADSRRHASMYVPESVQDGHAHVASTLASSNVPTGGAVGGGEVNPYSSRMHASQYVPPNSGGGAGAASAAASAYAHHMHEDMQQNSMLKPSPVELGLPSSDFFLQPRRTPRRTLPSLYMPQNYRNFFHVSLFEGIAGTGLDPSRFH